MSDIILNKQVNVWRGPNEPPTIYHVWIYDNKTLKLHDGQSWKTFLDAPGLSVSIVNNNVRVSSGETYFDIVTQGNALRVTKNGNNIIFQSNALTTIPTDDYLNWTGEKLEHVEKLEEGKVIGPTANSNSNEFFVPSITVDKAGHVIKADSFSVSIPDRVVQNPLSVDDPAEYDVILAGSTSHEKASGEVNKDQDLKYKIERSGNDITKKLVTPGIEARGGVSIAGNLVVADGYTIRGTVVGNVTGTATPTNHADVTDKYGAATSPDGINQAEYGHVKLQDTLPNAEPPKGYEQNGKGIAATPNMVYKSMVASKQYSDDLFGTDFDKEGDGKYYINWEEIPG